MANKKKENRSMIKKSQSYSLPVWVHERLALMAARDRRNASDYLTQILYKFFNQDMMQLYGNHKIS